MIFGWTWNHNNYGAADKNAVFVRAQVESGGTIWNFVDPGFITDYGLQYFKYFRFGVDVRRNRVIDKNTVVAYRFNGGVAYPYGDNESLPYEKFFFAGGSNSIRAWRPRRLGPGSYKPNLSADPKDDGLFDYNIEKPADILLEGSIELRRNLFGFVDGAIFLDAGNVWTFKPWIKKVDDEVIENGNSEFKWDQFLSELGIGTGFGVRFDFTFLILRFDVGIKVYDPARDPGDRLVLSKMKFFKPFGVDKEPVIYNIGIGFPF
jgi:outer membrane protein assembly factor BamA